MSWKCLKTVVAATWCLALGSARIEAQFPPSIAVTDHGGVDLKRDYGAIEDDSAVNHQVTLSWGHQTSAPRTFFIKLAAKNADVVGVLPGAFEADDQALEGGWKTNAGGGDVDRINFTVRFPSHSVTPLENPHRTWQHLLNHGDSDSAARLRQDPSFRPDARRLTIQTSSQSSRGFSITGDQMQHERAFWIPELDIFVAVGNPPVSFSDHLRAIQSWHGRRVLDQVARAPEASYAQFTAHWEDMGNPRYETPHAPYPGHVVGITWDSAIHKFGIDRGAGVQNDYGNPDRFRFSLDEGELTPDLRSTWKGQELEDGLPIITTRLEKAGVRYEIEQFAYPLHGPPDQRRGDIPMVLLQRVTLRELEGKNRRVDLGLTHRRKLPDPETGVLVREQRDGWLWEEATGRRTMLHVGGTELRLEKNTVTRAKAITNRIVFRTDLAAHSARDILIKIPSPLVSVEDRGALLALRHTSARQDTLRFWRAYLARGAQFDVPDQAVNTLFRANLWHALRLPRRHGGEQTDVRIDLPYSNFAYDQNGTPWPVNQAIYVDYMLYDLRGHNDIAAEELATIFRNNQEANGRIGGHANWGVYTPSMIYAVAKHYLLSGDRTSLERLLPQVLRAFDWCLGELKKTEQATGPTRGMVLAPLNDLSHDSRAWAFNQAYFFAAADLLARALERIEHPRAAECHATARALYQAVDRGFGHASMCSPLVQLADRTWIPYVPGDAMTPGRSPKTWYPTDVDTGPLHLSRLKALDPNGLLTTCLLNDHEDNLFYRNWGMANEPVYNQQATAYLLRDNVEAVVRSFYSMMACAFSHTVFEPVEHRWGWGQYFGPPSTDGAWFELYRNMLIHERDDDTLLLLGATPRRWLAPGAHIRIERAPTYYGRVQLELDSQMDADRIIVKAELTRRRSPRAILLRLRHPRKQPIRSVRVNGQSWTDFDRQKECIRISRPSESRYTILALY